MEFAPLLLGKCLFSLKDFNTRSALLRSQQSNHHPHPGERTLPDSLQVSAVWNCIALGAAEGGETEPLKHLCWLL